MGKLWLGYYRNLVLKGRIDMGAHKKVSRPKDPATLRDPHYTEFDTQKERNIQKDYPRITSKY